MSALAKGLPPLVATFCSRRLERVFNQHFALSENTLLLGGAGEPYYLPAGCAQPASAAQAAASAGAGTGAAETHRLYYRADFFASALHEVAHWCIAGKRRRLQADFGYWYAPEGRSAAQQQAFEAVEVAPQALEWFFARACGYQFMVSTDNLDPDSGLEADNSSFRLAVYRRAQQYQRQGLPLRAQGFYNALAAEFGNPMAASQLAFCPSQLGLNAGCDGAVAV